MDADAAPTASGPISKGDPRMRADPDRAWMERFFDLVPKLAGWSKLKKASVVVPFS
jgi:hypothetical protein